MSSSVVSKIVDLIRSTSSSLPDDVLKAVKSAARKEKNFAESDRLRDEIGKLGFSVKDLPGNTYSLKKL